MLIYSCNLAASTPGSDIQGKPFLNSTIAKIPVMVPERVPQTASGIIRLPAGSPGRSNVAANSCVKILARLPETDIPVTEKNFLKTPITIADEIPPERESIKVGVARVPMNKAVPKALRIFTLSPVHNPYLAIAATVTTFASPGLIKGTGLGIMPSRTLAPMARITIKVSVLTRFPIISGVFRIDCIFKNGFNL
jgi:hypothetical protein